MRAIDREGVDVLSFLSIQVAMKFQLSFLEIHKFSFVNIWNPVDERIVIDEII